MSIDDGLGFRVKDALVDLLVDKERRRQDLPRSRPPEGNTLLPACLILIIAGYYKIVVMAMVVL
jgi:hypothetical protein